ncbi:hypothetical protein XELAEV_18029436mg [Xenopus laevis]|uniref:GIY-YIG domain-containing protein n=1 Tax=Xenopus laevis TaxID=8355 RepID=A0A974CT79_XENLA|nr:hypothetical protein XELAEV_18029436mg [Xenopus laevis]
MEEEQDEFSGSIPDFSRVRSGNEDWLSLVWFIDEFINCNTKSVVYLLTCKVCYKQYVGCTVRPMKERIREHINTIRSGSEATVVSRHFKICSNSNVAMLKVQGIERVTLDVRGGDLRAKLLRAEVKWIHKLNTRQPQGLNSVFDVSCYI